MTSPALPQFIDVHKVGARTRSSASFQSHGLMRSPRTPSASAVMCEVCGYNGHSSIVCKFKNYSCRKCGSKGHLKRVCKSALNQNFLHCCAEEVGEDDGKRLLFNITSISGEPVQESVSIGDIQLKFELDTGSAVTAMSEKTQPCDTVIKLCLVMMVNQ